MDAFGLVGQVLLLGLFVDLLSLSAPALGSWIATSGPSRSLHRHNRFLLLGGNEVYDPGFGALCPPDNDLRALLRIKVVRLALALPRHPEQHRQEISALAPDQYRQGPPFLMKKS